MRMLVCFRSGMALLEGKLLLGGTEKHLHPPVFAADFKRLIRNIVAVADDKICLFVGSRAIVICFNSLRKFLIFFQSNHNNSRNGNQTVFRGRLPFLSATG